MADLIIKYGTTDIPGATVKGNFSYFSASTLPLGPSDVTGLYSGIDPVEGGFALYTGPGNPFAINLASDSSELNFFLIRNGAPFVNVNDNITWASTNDNIYINSGETTNLFYFAGNFTAGDYDLIPRFTLLNTDGYVNRPFNLNTSYGFNSTVNTLIIDSNRKILVGGIFTTYNNLTQIGLIRLNSDGTKDTSFDIGSGFDTPVSVAAIALQSDGKIVVGGNYTTYRTGSQNRLIRLNSDGTKDTSFDIGAGFNGFVKSIALQSDGKIVVGGDFTSFNGSSQNRLIRLNSDGSKDTSFDIGTGFNGGVAPVAINTNGDILVGGLFSGLDAYNGNEVYNFVVLNTLGGLVSAPYANGFVSDIYVDSTQILVSGSFQNWQLTGRNGLVRLNPTTYAIDASLSTGTGFPNGSTVRSIDVGLNGKIVCGGDFTSFSSTTATRIVRLNFNGSVDTSFNLSSSAVNSNVQKVVVNSNNEIFVGGDFVSTVGRNLNYLARSFSNGVYDTSFIPAIFNNTLTVSTIDSNGKILVGGLFSQVNSTTQNRLVRLNSDGSRDTSFTIGSGFNSTVFDIKLDSNQKILVGGNFTTYQGVSSGKYIRLNSDGSRDTSFTIGTGFNGTQTDFSIATYSDGRVICGGIFTTYQGVSQNRISRLLANGNRDTSFNITTGFNNAVNIIKIDSNEKILVGGNYTTYKAVSQNRLIRLNSDGLKDTSFNVGTGFDGVVNTIALQSDGKILVGGLFSTYNGSSQNRLIRLNSDGSKDTSFDIGTGFNNSVYSIEIRSNGKILIGGLFGDYNGIGASAGILLNTNGSVYTNQFNFNGPVLDVRIT